MRESLSLAAKAGYIPAGYGTAEVMPFQSESHLAGCEVP